MAVKFTIPDNVSKETARLVKDVLKELNKKKSIGNIDLGAINMLCISYEMYLQAAAKLLKEGPVIRNKYDDLIAHPAQNIATKNYAQVMKVMTEYGLTIKSRSQLKVEKQEKKESTPIEEYFDKVGRKEKR